MSDQRPTCRYCGSKNVSVDSIARWNDELQDWVLSSTLDSGYCDDCGEEQKHFNWAKSNRPDVPCDEDCTRRKHYMAECDCSRSQS